MPIKTVLVSEDGRDAGGTALDAALRIARNCEAHLEVLHARIDPRSAIPMLGEGMSGAMIEDMISTAETEANDRENRARDTFKTAVLAHDVQEVSSPVPGTGRTVSWRRETGIEDQVLARRGRLFDLIVCQRPLTREHSNALATLNAALFDSGRPVLVVPETLPERVGKRVVIAWNGSLEAARAVKAAMPLFLTAESIHILVADTEDSPDALADELADYLAWHGIHAEKNVMSPEGHGIGDSLLAEAGRLNADLIVMGAYTHNRLWQMILGGATSYALENAQIPMLLAH
ncbi:MAG: universal stress protein [Magnetospiraceae bacterium]